MRRYLRHFTTWCGCFAALTLLAGCPGQADLNPVTPTPPADADTSNGNVGIAGQGESPTDVESLTPAEIDALRSVLQATAQLTQAVILAQALATGGEASPCPAITATNSTVNASFGAGCTVTTAPEFVCSGNLLATRTNDFAGPPQRSQLSLTFQNAACQPSSPLTGEANILFNGGSLIDLNGFWNLSYTQAGTTVNLAGNGDLQYDVTRRFVNLLSFNGQLNAGGTVRSLVLLGLVLSRTAQTPTIPQTGTATVAGQGIRTLTLIFDANSPTTSQILISVDNGAPFAVDINNL